MDTKKYTIVIEGVEQSIKDIKSLKDVIDEITERVTIQAETQEKLATQEKEVSETRKANTKATDELGKVQSKLNEFDKEYALEVARAKASLKEQNDEVKKAVQQENDLKVIEEQQLSTYRDKQTYLTSLNRTIRDMTDTETVAGKTKEQLKQISEAVQTSLKTEDAEMAIYVRNVGNYSSAVDGFSPHLEEMKMSLEDVISAIEEGKDLDFHLPEEGIENGIKATKSLKSELKELQGQMAQMLADGVSPTDEGFLALAERAGSLKDAIGDASAEVKHFASDTAAMDNVINVVQTATASYGLLVSGMAAFGIENEEVTESIKKLEAAQTALNSLNTLSASLCDNSTMSYKLYHKALQMVGLEKVKETTQTTAQTAAKVAETTAQTAQNTAATAGTAATGALAVAEGTEAVAAGAAAVATGSFAAALWAAMAPLLAIVAIVGVVAAGIYGIVAAFEALFGPTEEETAAMERQCQIMGELNAKTEENITLLKARGATEAQVFNDSIKMYADNLAKLEEHVIACEEFYGEDSDEYKKAVEEKKKAEESLQKVQMDGLAYLEKVRAKYRDTERKNQIGEVAFKKEKAKEEYDYQIKLLESLVKQGKVKVEEEKKWAAEIAAAYKQALKAIDDEAASKSGKSGSGSGSSHKTSSTSRGSGMSSGSRGESDAQKAAKEFKKAAEELAKAVEKMQETTTNALLNQQKRSLATAKELSDEIELVDKTSLQKRLDDIDKMEIDELNIISASHNVKLKQREKQWEETQKKYKGHTELLKQYEEEYEIQVRAMEKEFQMDLDDNERKYEKLRVKANEQYEKSRLEQIKKKNDSEFKAYNEGLSKAGAAIDKAFELMLDTEYSSLSEMQENYETFMNATGDVSEIEASEKAWSMFWENIKPDKNFYGGGEEFESYIDKQTQIMLKYRDIFKEVLDDEKGGMTDLQKAMTNYYTNGLLIIKERGEMLKKEGVDEIDINRQMSSMYNQLVSDMGSYKDSLIEAGKIVGDFKQELNALGEVVYKVPTDGLKKSEKQAKKWGTAMKKFLNKYVEPFKETFDQMGESVNAVFDAINDWLQADIDKLADSLDEITAKYEELSDAVENTENTISSLKEEFKTASSSDKMVLGQKIADEEMLLAQEKAAQQEAYNEQQRIDKEKQKLEKEQAKRNIEQQQFNAGISLISAIINTAQGVSTELAKGIVGIPLAAIIGVLGGIEVAAIVAQIAALQSQKSRYAEGGYVDAVGMLQGPSHDEGGIDIKVGKSRVIEAEGGEFIINKKSSKKYYNLLTEINEYGKTGKTISGLNQQKFANGGSLNFEHVSDVMSDKTTEKQMQRAMESVTINPKVSVVDIIKKTNDYNRVRAYAGR